MLPTRHEGVRALSGTPSPLSLNILPRETLVTRRNFSLGPQWEELPPIPIFTNPLKPAFFFAIEITQMAHLLKQ